MEQKTLLAALGGVIIILGLGYGTYSYVELRHHDSDTSNRLVQVQKSLAEMQGQNATLLEQLGVASTTIDAYETKITTISQTVSTLEKIQATDKELLEKYSKVYFLNENYIPQSLSDVPSEFVYGTKKVQVLTQVLPFLRRLIIDARASGLDLKVISGYRSYGEQGGLKSSYKLTYGSGANSFSADQGYSEHQLGTTVDFTTDAVGDSFTGFSKTKEFAWLQNNAFANGFILSYPQNNGYYTFEPWHWRFVGTALATKLRIEGRYFYTLDQREIDTFLGNIFD